MKTRIHTNPNKNMIEHLLNFILPQTKVEAAMSIIDASGLGVWLLIENGSIHNLNTALEVGIKLVTLISLSCTVIYKIRNLLKKPS